MTNEMKNVPGLRFPEFDGDWEEKKLKDISNKGMYGIGASATDFDGENVYVRITDINESSRKINNDKLTSPDKLDKKYLLNENDVLFARTGASTGKTYIHKHYDRDKNYYFAGFLIKFEFKNNYLANFIFQNTLTKRFENWVSVMSVRSGQPGINSEEYGKLKMMFPSKVEQNKIGAFFSKLDHQIELEEQKLEKLEEQKKGYMQQIFSQQLRFKDENGDYYSEWKEKLIKDILEFENNRRKPITSSLREIGKYPYYGATGIIDYVKDYIFDGETRLLIGEDGAKWGAFEESSFIAKNRYWVNNHAHVCKSKINNLVFLNYLLNYKELRTYVTGNAPAKLTYNNLSMIPMFLPSVYEQEKIGNFLKKIDELIGKQNKKINELKIRKQGFLQKMFV